ncbi:ethanolamine ammonia-lyase reactivating factor EutA [Bacillus badius]|uniref:Ethanolamine utilization protein EutA n=1 Tax=Bacillus badius TaxID=1455 RepID=A0ABR5AV19_BACBA|nr:ethanolamine ammonia-lyase reactivating factor EutA [Bacillus badius]KIL76458.1 Ethanolamine utilization protein EutA [Bacillus badius]KIL78575.1 Ethanolamine utilization protein EutA [Bacillus badius]MED4715995.1 ethanolamine ammonia-lyase reactivating factor EutA [Bacillus badius]
MKSLASREETLLSAGIDIGTSTTKLVISRFSLMNMAGGSHVPRIEIIDKEILYRSPIFRTPLLSATVIDMEAVDRLVKQEYEKAGVKPEQIQTGAVIITGETATKQNAEEMVHHLSAVAGEFLVATAGPDLEGMIAAKGSGAYDYSKKTGKAVANIDIGGGTANAAVYENGKLSGTCTLHIGGRLIEFKEGKVSRLSVPVERLVQQKGWTLAKGAAKDHPDIEKVARYMAAVIGRMLDKSLTAEDEVLLLGHPPQWSGAVDAIVFSGGVSECIYQAEDRQAAAEGYNDIGTAIARAIQEEHSLQRYEWREPDETVRATVLGAGTQTTNISGATIQVESSQLPQKNLPVFEVSFEYEASAGLEKLRSSMEEAIAVYDPGREGQNFVLYFTHLPHLSFRDIQSVAKELIQCRQLKPKPSQPLVIALQSDHAKVLGQTFQALKPEESVLCIDQIEVEQGDYMDIGQVLDSGVVPVVIKTLTFHS